MTGIVALTAITDISSAYVEEAVLPDAILADTVAAARKPTRAERWESFRYFMNNGWVVAACCTIVAAAVLIFIIRAGQGGIGIIPGHNGTDLTETNETDMQTEKKHSTVTDPYTWSYQGQNGRNPEVPTVPIPEMPTVPNPMPELPNGGRIWDDPRPNVPVLPGQQQSDAGWTLNPNIYPNQNQYPSGR